MSKSCFYQMLKRATPKVLKSGVKRGAATARTAVGRLGRRLRRPNLFRAATSERVGIVYSAPSEMSISERLFLYGLVRGLGPERVLEIGTRHGGSASIMAAALQDLGHDGQIVGLDPGPKITVPARLFHNRFRLIEKPSPDAIPERPASCWGANSTSFSSTDCTSTTRP